MCDPISLTGLAISAAASAAAYSAQQKQATAQAKYQNEIARQTGQLASQSYTDQTGVTSDRLLQSGVQAGQQAEANAAAATAARSTAAVSAAENGVAGASVDQLMADFSRQEALNRFALQTNQAWTVQQAQRDEEGMRAEALGRIAQSRPGPVAMPSALATGLQIGGAALSSYTDYLKRQPPNPNAQAAGASGNWLTRPLPPFRQSNGTFTG